ncbi:protein of unknown function [Burkholderia multivorans]
MCISLPCNPGLVESGRPRTPDHAVRPPDRPLSNAHHGDRTRIAPRVRHSAVLSDHDRRARRFASAWCRVRPRVAESVRPGSHPDATERPKYLNAKIIFEIVGVQLKFDASAKAGATHAFSEYVLSRDSN